MLALNRQNYYNQYVAAVPAADYLAKTNVTTDFEQLIDEIIQLIKSMFSFNINCCPDIDYTSIVNSIELYLEAITFAVLRAR